MATVHTDKPEGAPVDYEPAQEAPITGGLGTRRGAELVGLALVGLGLVILAGNLRLFDWGIFLPLALVALGVALLLGRGRASAE